MPEKVSLFVDSKNDGAPLHFTAKLAEAMNKRGIEASIVPSEKLEDPAFLRSFMGSPPDFTASFFRPERLSLGQYIWEVAEIPHVAFLSDPLIYFSELPYSSNLTLTSPDRTDASSGLPDFPRVIFWPFGVAQDVGGENAEKDIDVIFFGGCFDFIDYRREWKKKLSGHFNWVIDFAIDIALINSSITLTEALRTSLETAGLNNRIGEENFQLLFHYYEKFMIGKDRFELLHAIRDAEVHVYGESLPVTGDSDFPEITDLFLHNKNVVFHPPVSYEESLALLKRSKICLNSFPSGRDGANPRPFEALACGSLPIVSDSQYLSETLFHGEDILYYKANHWYEVNEWLKEYLSDEKKRKEAVLRGREKVMRHHTWDTRLDQLLESI